MHLTIVSGLSGAGKSVALHTLEDHGYYCIDNLPGAMLPDLIAGFTKAESAQVELLAVGIDARSELQSIESFVADVDRLRTLDDLTVTILFLETSREILIKRFSETRRKHPLSSGSLPLIDAIREEERLLVNIKERADLVLDTSALNLHQLRDVIRNQLIEQKNSGPALQFRSFGFKHGVPRNTDFIFDVRCLPNPHWDPNLRIKTGLDTPVIEFLQQNESVSDMYRDIRDFVERWLPVFSRENRAYLTVSIGCTGGQHRSVYLADQLGKYFVGISDNVSVSHRELV